MPVPVSPLALNDRDGGGGRRGVSLYPKLHCLHQNDPALTWMVVQAIGMCH